MRPGSTLKSPSGPSDVAHAETHISVSVTKSNATLESASGSSDMAHAETHISLSVGTPSPGSDPASAPTIAATPSPDDASAPVGFSTPPDSMGGPRYEAGALLGTGGMGEVRLHVDRRIGRPIALKTLRAEQASPTARTRFLREARVQGQLEHPSIVPVYDLATDEDERASRSAAAGSAPSS